MTAVLLGWHAAVPKGGALAGLRQVVVESGHMVDAPDRPVPRFPREVEARIATAIEDVLQRWEVGPGTLVLSQGARGTDILVAESALRRGAHVKLLLALAQDEFEAQSVWIPESRWSQRFRLLLGRCEVAVQATALGPLPAGENPFDRNNRWVLDEAAHLGRRERVPVRALVVWDREQGDGAGGTADFAAMAERLGMELQVIEPGKA